MDADEVRDFIRTNGRGVLSTLRRDGGVQMSPVLVVVDDDGSLIISTTEAAAKTRNLRRRPYVYFCAISPQFFGAWAAAEGPVTIESLPEAMEGLVRYYLLAAGEHPDWDEYRAAMVRDRRVLVRIQIERAGLHNTG